MFLVNIDFSKLYRANKRLAAGTIDIFRFMKFDKIAKTTQEMDTIFWDFIKSVFRFRFFMS